MSSLIINSYSVWLLGDKSMWSQLCEGQVVPSEHAMDGSRALVHVAMKII